MILAVDVYYKENTAKTVGFLFSEQDLVPHKTYITYNQNIEDYMPGKFYKRELPCILSILEEVNIEKVTLIIIDGHIYIDNNKNYGLGGFLYEKLNCKIPVIGVAKNSFLNNNKTVQEVYRGKSLKPLYVSSIGLDLGYAASLIKNMPGKYRIPDILKNLDTQTKE